MAGPATAMQALRAPAATLVGQSLHGATASVSCCALALPMRRSAGAAALESSCSSVNCNSMLGRRDLPALRVVRPPRSRRSQARAVSPRAESAEEAGNSVGIWLGRAAMLGFVGALGVEIFSGKGLLEAAGLATPAPNVALALTAAVGLVTAFSIFQSGSKE